MLSPVQHLAAKTASITVQTPEPSRFVIRNGDLVDLNQPGKPIFFRGLGYSPFLPGETPLYGANPGNDDRYEKHLSVMADLGVTYLHVFPRLMPSGFFSALDRHNMIYGQDVWIWPYQEDFLDPAYQEKTLADIKEVIDHTYRTGRPDRLLLFSIGDELQAASVISTDTRHHATRNYQGKHLTVTNRTPSEIAMAMLIDNAMDYELRTYGQRHLYCHTSWTHIGPVADRPDLEVPQESVFTPDMGDLVCLNIYTYANGVRTSAPGSQTGTAYQGYLEELATATDKPILITQVGLSTSPIEPKPWVPGFGGHAVEAVPSTFGSIWNDVCSATGNKRFVGLVFFEFLDEWWKSGETPDDAKTHAPTDPEEWFGLFATNAEGSLLPKGSIPEAIRTLFTAPASTCSAGSKPPVIEPTSISTPKN